MNLLRLIAMGWLVTDYAFGQKSKGIADPRNFTGTVDYPTVIDGCEPSLLSSGYTEHYEQADLGYDPYKFVRLIEQGLFASALVYEYTGKLEMPLDDNPDMFWLTRGLREQDPVRNDCLYYAISEQPIWRDVWKPHVEQIALEEGTPSLRRRLSLMRRLKPILSFFTRPQDNDSDNNDNE